MFPIFTFLAVWHFVIMVLYLHFQAAIKIRDYFAIPVKFATLFSTYSLKTYNIRRLECKQFETLLFFPLPWFYSPLICTTEGSPQKPDSNTRPFHVRLGVHKVTMGHFSLQYIDLRVNIIPPQFHIHLSIYYRGYIISGLESVVKWHGRLIFTDVISQTYIYKAILSQYSGFVTCWLIPRQTW